MTRLVLCLIKSVSVFRCNVDTAGDAISTVGHFTVSTADNANYPNIWAIKTNTYAIFRITNKEPLYLKATVGFCEDEAGLCLDVSAPIYSGTPYTVVSFIFDM